MPFNSLYFLLFFCLVSTTVLVIRGSYRTIIILCSSYFFYALAGLSSISYLLAITLITYSATKAMERYNKRKVCTIAISILIILLVSSKYSLLPKFINESNTFTLEHSLYMIPIGISFYTLQAIGLLIDVKNNKYNTKISLKEIALFTSFFPLSIAGPIHRAKELIPQFKHNKTIEVSTFIIGLKTMLFGFICKLIVADKLALVIDPLLSNHQNHNGLLLYISALLYSFQIYFDFWGYSLIAIGIGKCLGYEIKINFNNPYSASSIKEFWHRWHISLSQWMRDYIYIPIGGNKKGYTTFFYAVFATFFLSGIWHGLSLNFVLWGLAHMALFLIDDFISKNSSTNKYNLIAYIRRFLFLATIPFTWLIFRTSTTPDLYNTLKNIFLFSEWSLSSTISYFLSAVYLFYMIVFILVLLIAHSKFINNRVNTIAITTKEKVLDSIFLVASLILIILFGDIGTQQFLYFNF